VIGTGSLDGFAAGALMSVVCAMAITAPWRPGATVEAVETARTGMAWAGLEDESFGAAAERLARPDEGGAQCKSFSAGGLYDGAAGGYRSPHRRGDPSPFGAPRGGVSPRSASEQSAFPGTVFPRIGFGCGRSRRDAHPDIEFSDALALVPFASARRPEARRPPRHAAPSIGLRSRIAGIGSRMTGLLATRALVSSARG
jgi:hypothetical protein